jgi:hypothetical protein
MSLPDRLSGVRAKIERAKRHISELEGAIQVYRDTDPFRSRVELDPTTGEKVHRFEERHPVPPCLALIAGDAIHNLRSVLDHLVWQLVEANGNKPTTKTAFPIYDAAPKDIPAYEAKVKGMRTEAERLIDSLQPYKGGNKDIWKLHRLDIVDKHNLLLVAACAINGVASPPIDMEGDLSQVTFQFNIRTPIGKQPDGTYPILKDGTEVVRLRGSTNVLKMDNCDLIFEIALAEARTDRGHLAIPFLHQLTQLVEGIVNQFVRFL